MSFSLTRLGTKKSICFPHQNSQNSIPDLNHPSTQKMSVCVACSKPLEVEIERDEDDEYENGASSSSKAPATAPETVPDDVQMSCGCHFHWLGISQKSPI
jgi:hypothetical protein